MEKPAATESSKPKVSLEETKDPEKHEVDVGGTDDDESDEDFVDSEEGESDDDEVGISDESWLRYHFLHVSVFSLISRLFYCDTGIKYWVNYQSHFVILLKVT